MKKAVLNVPLYCAYRKSNASGLLTGCSRQQEHFFSKKCKCILLLLLLLLNIVYQITTNHFSTLHYFAVVVRFLDILMVFNMRFLYFFISTKRSMWAVRCTVVFSIPLISCFASMFSDIFYIIASNLTATGFKNIFILAAASFGEKRIHLSLTISVIIILMATLYSSFNHLTWLLDWKYFTRHSELFKTPIFAPISTGMAAVFTIHISSLLL